jgi:UDP-N-acetylglucosamine 2-epimerase (non-hydrolysing)
MTERYPESYALVTLHRPSNVDDPQALAAIMRALDQISRDLPVVFPVHPRTRQRLVDLGFAAAGDRLDIVEPLPYLEFLALQNHARLVITDSGGVQEETTFLGVPCFTVRQNTERPVTVTLGTNTLVGTDVERLRGEVRRVLRGEGKQGQMIPYWDGRAAGRIVAAIKGWSETDAASLQPT